MKFDFSDAAKAKESGNRIEPGIKNATFEGVDFNTITSQKTGDVFKVMSLKLNIEGHGEFVQNFFEPQSDERTEMTWGTSASQLDHFKISVMEILEAISPEIVEKINSNELTMSGSFKQIVDFVKAKTADKIGMSVQVKLIPQNNGFVSIPSYPARITRNGELGIATRFIGQNLTLSSSELKKIEAAKEAKPTNMATKVDVKDTLSGMKDDLNDDSDLPF